MSLHDTLITDPRVMESVMEIVKTATEDDSLSGKRLHVALVVSGMALGTEEIERAFADHAYMVVKHLREVLVVFNTLIQQTNDDDTIKTLDIARKQFQGMLDSRANGIRESKLRDFSSFYGIGPEFITGECQLSDLDTQNAGLQIAIRHPLYFTGWMHADYENKLATMRCRCASCLAQVGVKYDSTEQLRQQNAIRSGIGHVIQAFANFVLLQLKYELDECIKGTRETHDAQEFDATAATKDIMSRLQGGHESE